MLQKGGNQAELPGEYPRLQNEDLYILRTGNKVVYAKLRALLENVGYSEEDLKRDETDAGYVEKEEKVLFQVGIRYELVDGDLVVTIPVDRLAMPGGLYHYNHRGASVFCLGGKRSRRRIGAAGRLRFRYPDEQWQNPAPTIRGQGVWRRYRQL